MLQSWCGSQCECVWSLSKFRIKSGAVPAISMPKYECALFSIVPLLFRSHLTHSHFCLSFSFYPQTLFFHSTLRDWRCPILPFSIPNVTVRVRVQIESSRSRSFIWSTAYFPAGRLFSFSFFPFDAMSDVFGMFRGSTLFSAWITTNCI